MTPPLDDFTSATRHTSVNSGVDGMAADIVHEGTDFAGMGFQAMVCTWDKPGAPSIEAMREAHRKRLGGSPWK